MDTSPRMAVVGSGLVMASFGLGVLGVALIAPAVFARGARLLEHQADGVAAKLEGCASKTSADAGGSRGP